MTRYFIELSYKGTAYNGWQIQNNAPSVQQTVQDALSLILQEPIQIVGAGRTDTGVHASYYIAHVETANEKDLSSADFQYHLNSVLPKDIAIHKIYIVSNDMHARFSAKEREYKYYISMVKDPFKIDTAYQYIKELNVEIMQEAANVLVEYRDFTSFAKLHADAKTNICSVKFAGFEKQGDMLIFTIRSDRFLRNMVRAIVGTLLEVGKGKVTVEQFRKIIEAEDRGKAKTSAFGPALFLTNIKY